jgi:hypothetical protein
VADETRARCCATGCPGELVPLQSLGGPPDFWVRVQPSGNWDCSTRTPEPPREAAGRLIYRCATCRKSYRIVAHGSP